jgi:hypothetical protein
MTLVTPIDFLYNLYNTPHWKCTIYEEDLSVYPRCSVPEESFTMPGRDSNPGPTLRQACAL